MKKILALIMAVVMMFSMVAVPTLAAASDSAKPVTESCDVAEIEADIDDVFDFAKNLATAIHNLVGGILGVLGKECPFCAEIHSSEVEDPSDDTTEDPSDDTTEDPSDEPTEIVLPELPALPVDPVHPENAIYVETVDGAADAIANAKSGDYIVLADGLYDEIVVTKSNITLAANNAKVGFLNLNGKSNVTIIGLDFLADYAKKTMKPSANTLTGYYANITGTTGVKNTPNGHNIVIKHCTFTGTPVDVDDYAPISVDEYRRSSYKAYNYTIEGCVFAVNARYYAYLSSFVAGKITLKNNIFGGKDFACYGAFWSTSNTSDLEIKDNYIFNWTDYAIGTSRQTSVTEPITIAIEDNTFVQVAEDASVNTLFLKSYKASDLITLATLVTDSNEYFGTISAETAVIMNQVA